MVNYQAWERQLDRAALDFPPAEVQGCLCGYLASGARSWFDWQRLLDDDPATGDVLAQECYTALRVLFTQTLAVLDAGEFELTLLLPDDAQPLVVRVEALRAWCEGFLYGYGASGQHQAGLDTEQRDLLRDIEQISRAELEESGEAEEHAYAELVEFLRLAATSFYLDHPTKAAYETTYTDHH